VNRLWVHLSLAFAGVVVVVMLVIGASVRLTVGALSERQPDMPPEVRAYLEEVVSQESPVDPFTVIIVVGVVAIGAGVVASRALTAPLQELGEAAQAIGEQELSRRVSVRGTEEVKSVASRFNEMAEQLEEAESLRSNLLADVAHELRNPLHLIQGNLQAILDNVYPLSKKEIARLADQTRYLTSLVDDLHELSLAEAHQLPLYKEQTDMANLVRSTAEVFKPIAAAKNIAVRVQTDEGLPVLEVDTGRMRQVLHNLLSNALRHTPAGGDISVAALREEDTLIIRVSDSGEGIAVDDLPHVFDRFYRTDWARSPDKGGAGLGLAIVQAIVEEHGGRVTAESPGANQGSTFAICLPVGTTA
jgi:signal transduction histidine kinase